VSGAGLRVRRVTSTDGAGWTAPAIDRYPEPSAEPERRALEAWLDYHRDTLLTKCAGLSEVQLRERSVPPSSLSLLGLVRHLAEVERWWFRIRLDGQDLGDIYCTEENPDGDFDDVDTADAQADLATYRAEVQLAREAAAGKELEASFERRGETRDLRWVFLHMIEEYARHNGHADLLRERIDGAVGD
jgi:uncharacterized damage-inducible protein DinB